MAANSRKIAATPDLGRPLPLFVYGTLRPGMANHDFYLQGVIEKILPATLNGTIHIVDSENYPYLLPGEKTVYGDLVYLKRGTFNNTICRIDRLEDFYPDNSRPSLYVRRECQATIDQGKNVVAWTYYWNAEYRPGRMISSGDFCKYLQSKTINP